MNEETDTETLSEKIEEAIKRGEKFYSPKTYDKEMVVVISSPKETKSKENICGWIRWWNVTLKAAYHFAQQILEKMKRDLSDEEEEEEEEDLEPAIHHPTPKEEQRGRRKSFQNLRN